MALSILLWHLSGSAHGRAKNVKLGRRYLDQDSKQSPPEKNTRQSNSVIHKHDDILDPMLRDAGVWVYGGKTQPTH
jgi:hypothetical protein